MSIYKDVQCDCGLKVVKNELVGKKCLWCGKDMIEAKRK